MKNKIISKTGKYMWELVDFPHNKKRGFYTSISRAKCTRSFPLPIVGEVYPCYMLGKVSPLYRTDAVVLGIYSPVEFKRLFPEEYSECRDVVSDDYGRYWYRSHSPFYVRAKPLYEAEGDDDTDEEVFFLSKRKNWLGLRQSRIDISGNLEKTYWNTHTR